MKKLNFNLFQRKSRNKAETPGRTQSKKTAAASYSDFSYRPARKPANRFSGTPQKKQSGTILHMNKKRLAMILAVAVAAVTIPVLFATAANTNQVATIAQINLSMPTATPDLQAKAAPATESLPTTTEGQLTGELTEEFTAPAASVEAQSSSPQTVPADTAPTPSPEETVSDPNASVSPSATLESAFSGLSFTEGTTDPFVPMIQQRLMDLDYMDQDETTDLFGPVTSQSIEFFQRKNNLNVDGVAELATLELLFSNDALRYTVSEGDSGVDVESVQDRLDELGYDISTTGYFGTDTKKAVLAFQKRNDLTDDGKIGADTKEILYSGKAKGPRKITSNSSGGGSSTTHIANPGSVEGLIQAATAQLGKSYVLGGKGPNVFDCSGLVYYSLKLSGNGIGYMTSGGWASSGYARVNSMSELRRGDIICLRGHVAIYLGGGEVIHASSSRGGVVRGSISSSYWSRNFICGRRPL